jgi:hypothetical protein
MNLNMNKSQGIEEDGSYTYSLGEREGDLTSIARYNFPLALKD